MEIKIYKSTITRQALGFKEPWRMLWRILVKNQTLDKSASTVQNSTFIILFTSHLDSHLPRQMTFTSKLTGLKQPGYIIKCPWAKMTDVKSHIFGVLVPFRKNRNVNTWGSLGILDPTHTHTCKYGLWDVIYLIKTAYYMALHFLYP